MVTGNGVEVDERFVDLDDPLDEISADAVVEVDHHIDFQDYNSEELMDIAKLMAKEVALAYGARWEDDELVTYDLATLRLGVASGDDEFLNDNDAFRAPTTTLLL
jgi:hypothetical protein